MTQMVIYTYGASEYINSVLESMSLLFDFSKHSELVWMYRIAAVLGVMALALRPFAAKGPDGSPGAIDWPWFFRFAMIMFVIVVPKSDVQIEDITLKKTYVVSNAPWALSTFGWLTSTIGYGLTEMYESVMGGGMNPIESYSGNGIAFGSQYYNALPSLAQIDANGMQVAQPFIAECLLPAITPINTRFSGFTRNQLFNSPNYMDAMRGMSTNYLKNRYVYTSVSNGTVMTCLELRDSLLSEFNQQGEIILNMAGLKNWNTITELDNTYIKQATDASANSLKQAMMINAIYSSVQAQAVKLGDSGTADSLYQARAQYQQISSWRQGSQFASVSLVWLHIVIESMAYALWPLISFLILFPAGWQVLMEYIKVLFWIQLWPVMYAILNSIIAVYAVNRSSALALQYGGFTLSSFFRIGDMNGGIVSTAGYLSTMVPLLTWMLLQRAGLGVMAVAGGFTSATNSSATEAGKQEALGDMQINRVNMGDRNFTTTTTTGENVNKNISSAGTVTSVGDVSTIQSSAMDNKLISGVNYQQAAQHQLSNQRSELETQAGSAKTAFANARQSLYNAQKGTQASDNHTTGNGLNQNDAVSNSLTILSKLQASLGIGAGDGATIGASGGLTVQALNDAKESLSKLKESSDNYSHGGSASISNAFTATQGVIQQSEKMISMAESYQKMESTLNSSGYSIQTNGDMGLVKDLKSQGYNEQQMLEMQQNDPAKFNQLANDFAGRYVRSLGDAQSYSAESLNHDATQAKIKKLSNQYGNNGGNDSVTGAAQQSINDKTAYVTHENQQQQDLYEYQNQKQNDPQQIVGDQASQVGGTAGKVLFSGLTRRGEKEAERIANGGDPVGKKYLTGKN